MTRFLYSMIVSAVLLLSIAGTVSAQVSGQDAPSGEVTADEVNVVARELWCPLCSGVRLDACELKACDQMKEVIAIKLSEGEDTESIKQYFVGQYGPQVLGEPPREGFQLAGVDSARRGSGVWRCLCLAPDGTHDAATRSPGRRMPGQDTARGHCEVGPGR